MWQQIVGWIKSCFSGGGGPVQIGRENQAVTGTTSGPNSPVINAGRDVHVHAPRRPTPPVVRSILDEVHELMPELIGELRTVVQENPLLRDLIVLDKKGICYNWQGLHVRYSADDNPQIWQQIAVLEGHGLVQEQKKRFAYRISEEFARHLRQRQM